MVTGDFMTFAGFYQFLIALLVDDYLAPFHAVLGRDEADGGAGANVVLVFDEAFLMVLAIPQISGAVSSCAYHEMQALRLASLCPPSTTRPHIQEGYLIGEYPELRSFEEKMNLKLYETDFAQRLIGKFRFDPKNFWQNETSPQVPEDALYPNDHDALHELCARIKEQLKTENQTIY